MSDLVSIITPVYNAESFLKYTLDSIRVQSYKNWELIIVNDCSTDKSNEIIKEYLELDSRIRLIELDQNRGVAYARNAGIKSARGKFIAFLDGDDLWKPKKLERHVQLMKENNWFFTFSNYGLINELGTQLQKNIIVPSQVNYNDLLNGNVIGCLTVVLDKENISIIEMPPIKHEDYATWLNILKDGTVAYGINENLALYRRTSNSLSSNKLKSAQWTWRIFREHQKMNVLKASKCFIKYSIKAIIKHT